METHEGVEIWLHYLNIRRLVNWGEETSNGFGYSDAGKIILVSVGKRTANSRSSAPSQITVLVYPIFF